MSNTCFNKDEISILEKNKYHVFTNFASKIGFSTINKTDSELFPFNTNEWGEAYDIDGDLGTCVTNHLHKTLNECINLIDRN